MMVTTLLIANRGEIARRIIRTAHRMGIATVAVHSDADATALHVREATRAVALGGNASADTYLRIDKLIAAAQATGADAVHPGYGFLSENAEFAEAVIAAGLTWVGPPPGAIRALGNKSSAKQLALHRGVPCLPGYQGEDQSDERFVREAQAIGYPVMVKAAAGGGGRGMRLVLQAAQLLPALQSARSEALSGFGSAELLIERALLNPRHVEVQVFADSHGRCIHLGERDCSVQRRHQKIIEEAPSPAVSPALRARMGACAVELAQAAGYVGAGTVEFLLEGPHAAADQGASFYLMEMNTRLQVEHPVTEMITGLDLVEWQLRVARGEPLPLAQDQVAFSGHAIEVRLCAEDEDYTPHAGRVLRFQAPDTTPPGVRMDHALAAGSEVTPFYDSMVGKLITHAPTRAQAIDSLSLALAQTQVLGLPTNRAFLRACLAHPGFRAGEALIPFLAQQGEAVRSLLQKEEQYALIPAALAVVFASNPGRQGLPSPFARAVRLRHRGQVLALTVREWPHGQLQVGWQDRTLAALRDGSTFTVDGQRFVTQACQVGAMRWHVQVGGSDMWLEDASFEPAAQGGRSQGAADLRAPFNGKLIRLAVQPGQPVARGDTLLVMESMKLEHSLNASHDAVVESIAVETGQQLATGQVLVRFAPAAAVATASV